MSQGIVSQMRRDCGSGTQCCEIVWNTISLDSKSSDGGLQFWYTMSRNSKSSEEGLRVWYIILSDSVKHNVEG